MALRTRVWGAGKILVLVGALVVTYVIFAAASMRWALRAREVQVPDLTNHTAVEATAAMNSLGLTLKVDDARRIDPKVPAGRVMSQDPPAKTTTRQQRTVRIWLSAGQHATLVPSLDGQTERAAELRLAQDGLELGSIAEIRSESIASDIVVAQDPPANSAGVRVALLVNRAEQASNYVMPDLIGVNGERATAILRDQGFRVSVVGSTPYPGLSAGIVLRQSPQAGFQIAPGEPISIEVSR
jgi:eukaryotic-like serine/threonine-protein kinase